MFATLGEYTPGWFTAVAEEEAAGDDGSGSEMRSYERYESSQSDDSSSSGKSSASSESSSSGSESSASGGESASASVNDAPAAAHEASASEPSQPKVEVTGSSEETSSGDAAVSSEAAEDEQATEVGFETEAEAQTDDESADTSEAGSDDAQATVEGDAEAPAEDEVPVEDETPVEGEAPAEGEEVVEGEAPAEEGAAEGAGEDAQTLTVETELPSIISPASDADEAGEAPEALTFTTQAYTVPVMLAAADAEEKTPSILQGKINDALAAVTGTLTGRIQVLLTHGVTYDGEVSISKEEIGREVADDFELEIAEEAADEETDAAAGPATYTGTMNIKGINVAIHGIGLTGMVNVESAKLNYKGTEAADIVNVTAGVGANVDIDTGAGDDAVTANVTAGAAAVKTGEGDDTVRIDVIMGTAAVDTGEGNDSVTAAMSGNNKDMPTNLTVDSGAGDDTVKLTDDASNGSAKIVTGLGDDAVEVDAHTAGNGGIDVDTGAGDDTVTLKNTGSAPNPIGKLNVSLGSGNDTANVDVSLSTAVTEVLLSGGAGDDTANFTGDLGKGDETNKRVQIDGDKLKFIASNGRTLNVTRADFERLTDSLSNKETVKLTPNNGKLVYEAVDPGINYTIEIPAKDIKNLQITSKDGKYLPLSNLVINTATEVDGVNKLVISEGTIIDVRGLNLTLGSGNIEINGTIVADDVSITAGSGGKFLNVQGDSRIVITDKAAIYSTGDVMIVAKVTMAGPMLDTNALVGLALDIAPINSINVKIAHASVDIAGKVYAGVNDPNAIAAAPKNARPTFNEYRGFVTAKAETGVFMGVDENGMPKDGGWPVAVSVATVEASVNVQKGADIAAATNVAIASESSLKAGTRASSGFVGAPAAAAVAVLTNDAHTTVNGNVTAHHGSASITADGTLEATTVADRGDGQKLISGGYGAVTVALQDVKATVGANAVVNAAGDVVIASNAIEKVVDKAASSSLSAAQAEEDSGDLGTVKEKVGDLLGSLKDKLAAKITGSSKFEKKLKKALKLLPVSDKSVTLDSKAQQKGRVSADVVTENGKTKVKLNMEPWEGYKVKSVTVRGYLPGESAWNVRTLTADQIAGKKQVELDAAGSRMIVYVEYEEIQGGSDDDWQPSDLFDENPNSGSNEDDELDEDTWRPSDLFDLDDMLNDVQGGTDGRDERGASGDGSVKLELGGGVLTYDFLPGSPDKNLEKVKPGDAIRLIPNPASGKKLREGGLKATYTVREKVEKDGKEEWKDVEKTIVITQDGQGRYILNVPETFETDKGIRVTADFEDGAQSADADQSQTQIIGSVAVTVAHNDSQALIEQGATVAAGGSVDVDSNIKTDVSTTADGSSVSKNEIGQPGPAAPATYPISRAEADNFDGYAKDDQFMFGMMLGEMINGDAEFTVAKTKDDKGQEQEIPYAFVITPKPREGYAVASATLTYYQAGEPHTVELKKAEDGTYRVMLEQSTLGSLIGYYTLNEECYNKAETGKLEQAVDFVTNLIGGTNGIDKGSNIIINFAFASETESGVFHESTQPKPMLNRIIGIKYDKRKDEQNEITYKETKQQDDKTYYVFDAMADENNGYVLNGKLKAIWEGSDGVELEQMDGAYWYLDASLLPDNVKVTVTADFKEQFHDFKQADGVRNGTLTLYDAQVKKADKPRFTVKPDAGYSVDDIEITYTNTLGLESTLKLSDKDSKITKVKDLADVYTFTVEDMQEDSEIKVNASFKLKTIGVYAGQGDTDKGKYVLSEKNVASGDTVTVSLNEADVMAGKKIGSVKVEVQGKPSVTVKVNADGSFEVPKDLADADKLVVTDVNIVNKEVPLKAAALEHGSVTPDVPYADRNEIVTVTIKPEDGFKVKQNTLKALIRSDDGTYTEEVMMRRQSDHSYAFTMPATMRSGVSLTFEGEFEPGQSDSSRVNTSVGAGIAVSVVSSEGRADIKGAVNGGSVNAKSASEGAVATESKAGYSAGNIGVGGAVSVQVASVDSKALIHETAALNAGIEAGAIAANSVDYRVNADASGNKEAGKTGVGAGIAVAVNGADTYAAVADNAKLSGALIGGVSVVASQFLNDAVAAKAGASGGSAGVPVAAVDITGGTAQAYLGRLNDGARLNVGGGVNVNAADLATHTVSADASAAGKGVGAAIDVSVISDRANARLNQGLSAASVAVNAETESRLSGTATASASGGKQAADGGKDPDAQADSLLGMVGKLAGMNDSDGVSLGDIEDAGSENRQKAETGEGSVAVAGAVAVNVQKSISRSEIMSGVDVKSLGALSVTALNGTTASVKANASTTHSNVGVGVGVAVNIIKLQNIATLSDGEIEAAMLKVAANTKRVEPGAVVAAEPTPEELEALAKEEAKKTLTNEIGAAVSGFVKDLVASMGLNEYVSASLIGDITDKVAADATQQVLRTMGLDETLGTMTFEQIAQTAKAAVEQIVTSLSDAPAEGTVDKNADLTNALAALTDAQKQALKTVLERHLGDAETKVDPASSDSVKEALQSIIGESFKQKMKEQLPELPKTLMLTAKDGLVGYLKENVGGILSGLFADKDKGDDGMTKLTDQASQKVMHAVSNKVKLIITETLGKTVEDVAVALVTELPDMDMASILAVAVKEDDDPEAVNEAADEAAGKVNDQFAEQVPYKAMLENLSRGDFKTRIIDGLRAGAKQALVTLTGESLNALTERFDLALEAAENPPTGHIIDTQAISGAGAKNVGVAGSVAVTVLNAETKATIADSGKAVKVSGDMTVAADELRTVNNISSAAADASGDAVANLNAGAEETAQTGGGDEANSTAANEYGKDKKQTVKLTVGVGGTAEIIQAEKGENRPGFYITLKEGYKMPSGNAVSYSYKDSDGKEVTGTVTAQQRGDRWYVETKTGDIARAPEKAEITLELKPEEDLHAIGTPGVSGNNVSAGAVSVGVKGRDAKDGAVSAKVGDLVQIKVDRSQIEGSKVSAITYTSGGKQMQLMLDKDGKPDPNKTPVYALVSSNEKELIYTLAMPGADITDLQVTFAEAEEDDDSFTFATDEAGRSVGVGAAFSMVYGDSGVKADVGSRKIVAGALNLSADSTHVENLAAAAGTDPLGANADLTGTGIKDFAFDASVALNILDNDIVAQVARTAKVETTGYTATEMDEAGKEIRVPKAGDLKVTASETAVDNIAASAFSAGGSTAVGASVAINLSDSKAQALLEGGANVSGSAAVASVGTSADVTRAVATALGADIARGLLKLNAGAQGVTAGANSLLDGSAADSFLKGGDKPKGTDTNQKITDRLNEKKGEKGSDADPGLSVSQNVMRSQGVETQSENAGSEGTNEGMEELKENSDDASSLRNEDLDTSAKVQVGAVVGVNVTGHAMQTKVGTIQAGGGITATAQNIGNFNTQGTGAAMSFAEKANSIALGVAVSVNSNKANVSVDGDLVSTGGGDVSATADLSQNLTGDFAGKLATQSLSGSVAGRGSGISLGGAVSVLVSKGEATVDITGGSAKAARKLQGGSVAVSSTDKSRLASRAGGISLSRGSSVGMGIASNVIISKNAVKATVGDDTQITADSFKLNAEKKAVTAEDFKQLINLRTLVTDSSNLTDEQRASANTGLIDYHKTTDADGRTAYQANVDISSEKLLGLVDGLNFLSGQNTYVEAIAGSVVTGSSTASLSGSVAVAVNNNDIQAKLGNNVTVNANTGDADVTASNGATTRVIAGSLSAAPAQASVGATVAVLVNSDKAVAQTGDNANIDAAGGFKHTADQSGDTQLFTGAMSVATSGNALGGAVNVIVNKSVADSFIGNDAAVKAGKDADIHSKTELDLTLISGSANVGTGSVAAGGTVNVIVDKAESKTGLGTNNAVTAGGSLSVTSDSSTQMISGVASASVAASMGGTGAGAVNVIVSKSVADTTVGKGAALTATAGDMKLNANNDAWTLNATVAVAAGGGTAIGGSFNVNVFNRQATVNMADGTLNAGGSLYAQSSGRDTTVMAGLALAGGGAGVSAVGNVGVLVEKNIINTNITRGVTAVAGKNALLEAYFSDYTVDAAGSIAISGMGVGVGATVLTVVKNNDIQAKLGASDIAAYNVGGDAVKSLNGTNVNGVYVGANAAETQFLGGAGVAGSASAAVNGVVDVLVNNNTVIADASKSTLVSKKTERIMKDPEWVWKNVFVPVELTTNALRPRTVRSSLPLQQIYGAFNWNAYKSVRLLDGSNLVLQSPNDVEKLKTSAYGEYKTDYYDEVIGGDITVQAADDTRQTLLAGGLSASAGAGVGASVVTLVSNKTVKALAKDMDALKDVSVNADNQDEILTIAVSAGGGTVGVQIGAAVQVLKSKANALVSDNADVRSGGAVSIGAVNDAILNNAAAAVGGAAGAAVSPVAVVTYFSGEAIADLGKDSKVDNADGGDFSVTARANKEIGLYSVGFAVGGGVGVSGAGNVIVSKDRTQARVGEDAEIKSAGDVNVTATGDYRLRSASGAIAVGGGAGVGVNAVVSVLKSNTIAEMAGKTSNAQNVNVLADSSREVLSMGASVGVGGGAGVGVNVMVLVAGSKMSQDSADMLTYGNSEAKTDENKTFDPAKLLAKKGLARKTTEFERDGNGNFVLDEKGNRKTVERDTLTAAELSGDLEGNGHYETKEQVGSDDGNNGLRFDGASGYRSTDFDNEKFKQDGETMQGENLAAKDTDDVKAAKNLNVITYENEPSDAVIARITDTAGLNVSDHVNVKASQAVAADLVGAALAGGTAGVGVSASVVVLHSNVLASSAGNIESRSGSVFVTAESKSGTMRNDTTAADRDASVKKMFDKVNFVDNPAIRAIGGSVGLGAVGVAVGVGVVYTDNITQAVLGGYVRAAHEYVNAKHDYGTVLAGTGAVAGGGVGVSASVAVAQANGTVKAIIARGADVKTTGYSGGVGISVTTESTVNVDAVAATAAIGGVAVNAGVAVALNRLNQTTGIEAGTTVDTSDHLDVKATVRSASANSTLISAGLGGVAVGLGAAVSDVAANVNTFIGQSMPTQAGDTSANMPAAVINARKLTLKNDILSSASKPALLSVNAGAVSAAGNVLLAFNQTKAAAIAENADIKAKYMDVIGNLASEAVSDLTVGQLGGAALGISVNYADLAAENRASVNNSTLSLDYDLRVLTNEDDQATTAIAHTMAGALAGITVGFNTAIARNRTKNYATVIGDRRMNINGTTTIHGKGKSSADARFSGFSVSLGDIAASVVVAMNDADARTTVVHNKFKANGGLTLDVTQDAATNAEATTGGGSLVSAKVNVVMAYGKSHSRVDAAIAGGGEYAFLKSTNTARDIVTSTIRNSSFSALTMAAMAGGAYSQDVFSTRIQLTGGNYIIRRDADVKLDYDLHTTADTSPSSTGVSASLGNLAVNLALAKNTATAGAELEISIPRTRSVVRGNVNVATTGNNEVNATVRTAELSVSAVSVGANIARADLSTNQSAVLSAGGAVDINGDLNVTSKAKEAKADAFIGANSVSSKDSAKSISLVGVGVSKAIARENLINTAGVRGAASGTEKVLAQVDMGDYAIETITEPDYDIIKSVTYRMKADGKTITSSQRDEEVKKEFIKYYEALDKEIYDNFQAHGDGYDTRTLPQGIDVAVNRISAMKTYAKDLRENLDTRNWAEGDIRFKNSKLDQNQGKKENLLTPDSSSSALQSIYDYYTESGSVSPGGIAMFPFGMNVPIYVSMNRELLRAVAEVENIQSRDDRWKILQTFLAADDAKIEEYALMAAVLKADEENAFDWETTVNYGTVTHDVEVWKENLVEMEVEKAVFDAEKNHLTVKGDASVIAGMADGARSQASARTNGAKNIGIMSIGSLESNATSTDSASAIIEGTNVDFSKKLDVSAIAETDTSAVGFKSGSVGVLEVDHSDVKARVGAPNDKQNVSVVIGKDVHLNGQGKNSSLTITAVNHGYGVASMDQSDTSWSAGAFKVSTQTTENWLDTLITFGENTGAKAGNISIVSQDTADGESSVDSSSVGILMNFNTMQGKNTISQENNIDFGKSAKIEGLGGEVIIAAVQNTRALAETLNNGGGLISAGEARARNTVDRTARVNLAEKAMIDANNGGLTIKAMSGMGDSIVTNALTSGVGLASINVARANAEVNSNAEILIGRGANLESAKQTSLDVTATSHQNWNTKEVPAALKAILTKIIPNFAAANGDTYAPGINTRGETDAAGLVAVPNGVAHNTLNFRTYIGVNEGSDGARSSINSVRGGRVDLTASNKGLTAKTNSIAKGKGGFGVSNATATNEAHLQNVIWIDRADLSKANRKVTLLAANDGTGADRIHLASSSYAELSGLGGKVAPTSRVTGTQVNQIRTNDVSQVTMPSDATHIASSPSKALRLETDASYKRWEVDLWFFVLTLTRANVVKDISLNSLNRCDFCNDGQTVDVEPTAQDTTIQERHQEAFKRAINASLQARAKAAQFGADASANRAYFLAKGLVPLTYLNTLATGRKVTFKARYGEQEDKAAGAIFLTELQPMLEKDAALGADRLDRYRLWRNSLTQHDVTLLPNATRLYGGVKLDYVSEILRNIEEGYTIDVTTALNSYALQDPVIPIGSNASLNLSDGTLTLPALTDYELYLDEVSGAWLLKQLGSGLIRRLEAPVEDVNDYLLNDVDPRVTTLPTGPILEGLTPNGDVEGWKLYWLVDTPETAAEDDQVLIALLHNEETDEVVAFRTTRALLEANVEPVAVSLYIFRDSKSDRMGEVKYNVVFFDTPAGERSLVMVITNVLDGRELELPKPLKVVLRAFEVEGASLPAYGLTDHYFVMCDGTAGQVAMFDGFYTNTFDGDTFESDYMRIEGIEDGELNVTIKKDQPIWPEKSDETHAQDLNGTQYEQMQGVWQEALAPAA
ncbi:MAG: hypothetical protein IJ646_04290 [Clostridia bacterium]|nr:hypothetical protein [Clostridia bacterium]